MPDSANSVTNMHPPADAKAALYEFGLGSYTMQPDGIWGVMGSSPAQHAAWRLTQKGGGL